MTAQDHSTLNFYSWESRHRGWYHFEDTVDIEPPYLPFYTFFTQKNYTKDDGRLPSIFTQIGKLFAREELPEPEEEEIEIDPNLELARKPLAGLDIIFPKGSDISLVNFQELLSLLSFTDAPVTFEIIGTSVNIRIRFVTTLAEESRLRGLLASYFPTLYTTETDAYDFAFDYDEPVAIADFGYAQEFIRPIQQASSLALDPLTSIISAFEYLESKEILVLQILFKGVRSPLAKDIIYAVSDGRGGSFFENSPEMLPSAKSKIASSLFSVVMRVASQGTNDERSAYLLQNVSRSISVISKSEVNELIPLSNKGYAYDNHLGSLLYRKSHRLGMIMNTEELATFVHYPNKGVHSTKLHPETNQTKQAPEITNKGEYLLGYNEHHQKQIPVYIDQETFGQHALIAGASGSGKSHLMRQIIAQSRNEAVIVLDPHGSLVQDILADITSEQKDDVIYIDFGNPEYAFGFNIFEANSESEKAVLASDLASSFRNAFISSGDRIEAVLQKTINALVYSQKPASVLDIKKFLLEPVFRTEYLTHLDDPILEYYWQEEFPQIRRNELTPLLVRIDSFLQTRLLRNIFMHRSGIDFEQLIADKKTILINLSVGLMGLSNSRFLAELLISQITRIALARQSRLLESHHYIRLFCDEAHLYTHNSNALKMLLNSTRKYRLSLCAVTQQLSNFDNDTLDTFLTNSAVQIFFRLNDKDARRVASTFSEFELPDFLELARGEALCKVLKRSNDFNLTTFPITKNTEQSNEIVERIIAASRANYAFTQSDISALLADYLPKKNPKTPTEEILKKAPKPIQKVEKAETQSPLPKKEISEQEKQKILQQENEITEVREHYQLQTLIKKLAQERGFIATLEEPTKDNGKIDVVLKQNDLTIACEISSTNTVDYEIKNLRKCLKYNATSIVMTSKNAKHLQNIKTKAKKTFIKKELTRIHFLAPKDIPEYLNSIAIFPQQQEERIKGFRVVTDIENSTQFDAKSLKSHIAKKLFGRNS